MADYQVEDYKALMAELKKEDSRLRRKRRWLMNLPLSQKDRKRNKTLNPLSDKSVPEAMLREDDVYYEKIKNFVERVSGASTSGKEHAKNMKNFVERVSGPEKLFRNGTHIKNLSVLDGVTKKGLCSLSELVTEGLIEFEKMKKKTIIKLIRKHLPSYLDCENSDVSETRKDQISSLLNDPQYFSRRKREDLCLPSESLRGSAIQVLGMLEELPHQTLEAMDRRLKGEKGSSMEQRKHKRDLVKGLKVHCRRMLRKLDESEPLPESLVEALSIAGVTLKLLLGHTDITEFKRFSPEVEALQKSIAKAIRLINTEKNVNMDKVVKVACKKLCILSERKVEIPRRVYQTVRNRLIEFLVECGYMESIPKPLVEILDDINNTSRSSENEVEEEVEFLLCFSAQIKQVIWDNIVLSDEEEFDQDFATAYMEKPEDGGDEEDYTNEFLASRDVELDSNECDSVTESIGETKPDQSPYDSPNVKHEPVGIDDEETDSFRSSGFSRNQSFSRNRPLFASFEDDDIETKPDDSELKTNRKDTPEGHMQGQFGNIQNKYLWIQRACDETAMTMHRAIDGISKELTKG